MNIKKILKHLTTKPKQTPKTKAAVFVEQTPIEHKVVKIRYQTNPTKTTIRVNTAEASRPTLLANWNGKPRPADTTPIIGITPTPTKPPQTTGQEGTTRWAYTPDEIILENGKLIWPPNPILVEPGSPLWKTLQHIQRK